MKVLYPITLDVKKTNVQKIIPANQGEGLDRKLIITLVSGSENIILDSDNQSAQFVATKPDGTHIYNHAQIHDGKIIVYLTTQVVAAVGNVDCQIRVISGDEGNVADGNIYSAKFSIDVEAPLYSDEEIQSTNEFSELVELTEKVTKQVTVFTGEGIPDTNPATYENVKVSDFYYDSTNTTYYYAVTVYAGIVIWRKIIDKNALDTALALKQNVLTVEGKLKLLSDILTTQANTIYPVDDEPSTTYSDFIIPPEEGDLALITDGRQYGTNTRLWVCTGVSVSLDTVDWGEMLFHDLELHTGTTAPPTTMNQSHSPYEEGDFYRRTVTDGYELYYLEKIDSSGSGGSVVYTLTWLNLSDKYTTSEVDAMLALKQEIITAGNGIDKTGNTISAKLYNSTDNAISNFSNGLLVSKSALGLDTALREKLADTISSNPLQPKLTAGANITINSNNVISASASTRFEVVETLPVSDIRTDTIYLVPKEDPETGDYFDEYAYINGQWELLGTTKIDLSNYVTNAALAAALLNYQLKIDSSHKLDADLIEDGEVNKTVTAQEKSLWNQSHNVIIDSASGSSITLPDSTDNPFNQIFINGKSTQTGTPTIDSPIPITDTTAEEIEVTDGTNTQTTELDITLRGIPVASGGNYTDANNQQWICDTIERYANGTGKLVQRVNPLKLNGQELWTSSGSGRVSAALNIADSALSSPKSICDSLSLKDTGTEITNNDNSYIIANGRFLCSPTHNGTRLDTTAWSTFLSTNNVTVYTPYATPVETPLTAEQIAELNLDAYYPETQITSTPDITVYYICDLKNYIDKISS